MSSKLMTVHDLMDKVKDYPAIFDSFAKAYSVLRQHYDICCSISGGKDSDIIMDMVTRLDESGKVRYIWFNTGLEYEATKRHLDDLEKKYGVKIERIKAEKPIPLACREYGQPFLSKYISGQIHSLQRSNFQWEDEPLEALEVKYPKCRSALRWWCNRYRPTNGTTYSRYEIARNRYLKEFLIINPPQFKISASCCTHAKKKPAAKFVNDEEIDLMILGIRKAEGGYVVLRIRPALMQ